MIVFERREGEVTDFNIAYRVRMPAVARCRIMLGFDKMEEVSEFIYLGTVLCKHGGMDAEIRVSDERQESCGVTCWGNEREECVYGREERSEE